MMRSFKKTTSGPMGEPASLAHASIKRSSGAALQELNELVKKLDAAGRSEEVSISDVREMLNKAAALINKRAGADPSNESVMRAAGEILHNYVDAMKISSKPNWQKKKRDEERRRGCFSSSDVRCSNALQHDFLSQLRVWGNEGYLRLLKTEVVDRWAETGSGMSTLLMELNNMTMMMGMSERAEFWREVLKWFPDKHTRHAVIWEAMADQSSIYGMALEAKKDDSALSSMVSAICELPVDTHRWLGDSDERAARNQEVHKGNTIIIMLQALLSKKEVDRLPERSQRQVQDVLEGLITGMDRKHTWIVIRAVSVFNSKALMTKALAALMDKGTPAKVRNVVHWLDKNPELAVQVIPLMDVEKLDKHLRA